MAGSARCNIRSCRESGFSFYARRRARKPLARPESFFAALFLVCAVICLESGCPWPAQPLAAVVGRGAKEPVYSGQPLVQGPELSRFLEILPQFRAFVREEKEEAHPVAGEGGADFLYSPKAAAWLEARGWNARRFFCVMGRMAAALAIIEEGNDMGASLPGDMPSVSKEELALARRNLDALLRVGGAPAAPIRH